MAYYIPGTMERHLAYKGLCDDKYGCEDANHNIEYCLKNLDINENDSLKSPTDAMLLKKEQKDAELDKKIEALRKKNEALMKRYQEVEEDKKRAEQEGMAMQSRKGKVEDLTITINKSPIEKRVVTKKGSEETSSKGLQNQVESISSIFGAGRGKRRQLLVTAPANTKGKRMVSERVEKSGPFSLAEIKHPAEDKGDRDTITGKSHCPNTKRASQPQIARKQEHGKGRTERAHHESPDSDPSYLQIDWSEAQFNTDLDILTSGEDHLEYLRWKKEREEIDRQRVARHKNSQGQWRRAWDMDKPEFTFSEKVQSTAERETQSRGGRNARRGHSSSTAAESRGAPFGQHDKRRKNLPVVGSKATGKDRLTGRARRWDAKENETQVKECPETVLEEFLEELDALCDHEVNTLDIKTQGGIVKSEPSVPVETMITNSFTSADIKPESQHVLTDLANTENSTSKSTEKKVRFSDNIIQGASEKTAKTGPTEMKVSSLKITSQVKTTLDTQKALEHTQDHIKNIQEEEVIGTFLTDCQSKMPSQVSAQEMSIKALSEEPEDFLVEGTESENKDQLCYSAASQNGLDASASTDQDLLHPVEYLKNSISRNAEELMDSTLSVLSLESGDSLPDHSTSTEKARENGKIV